MRIPKFSGTTGRCVRCGHRSATIQYCTGTRDGYSVCHIKVEHFDCICNRCGYKWYEACLKLEEEVGPPEKRLHSWSSRYTENGLLFKRCMVCGRLWETKPDRREWEEKIDWETRNEGCCGKMTGVDKGS